MIKINKHDRRACCSAFLLFVFTGVLTLSVLVGALFGNPARMVRSLGGDTYVDGLYTEVHQYAADLCLEYGLDTAVADAVTKDGVRTAVQTYAGVMLKSKDRSAKLAPALQEVRTALETAAAKAAPGATTAQVQDLARHSRLYGWPYGAGFCSGSAKLCKSEYASLCGRGRDRLLRRSAGGMAVEAQRRCQAAPAPAGGRRYLCRRTGDGAMHCDAGAAVPKDLYIFPAYLCAAATRYMIDWLYMCLGAADCCWRFPGLWPFARKGKNCKG